MSNAIIIGTAPGGAPVQVDVEELLATRLLVQGNSGSGKSHLLRRLLEESAPLVQQVVIDPEGDFVTLAEPYGHVVIDADAYAGADIARLAARIRRHRASVVLALDGLEVEAQMKCAAQFLNALFDAPREQWFPALVVVDEAQLFAPAAAGDVSDEARRLSLAAMTNLMCRGRKRGLAGVIATQRLAKLAKNVAAEASNFLMGRTFLDIDMQRATDLLGMERRQAERIRDLERGEFLALGPAITRRPVPVRIGATRTAPRQTVGGLMPRPTEPVEDMFALLHADLAEEAAPAPVPTTLAPMESVEALYARISTASLPDPLTAASGATEGEEAAPGTDSPGTDGLGDLFSRPQPPRAPDAAEAAAAVAEILAEMAEDAEASFRPVAVTYQDFSVRCRMRRLPGSLLDLAAFRRRFAMARAGFGGGEPNETEAALLEMARGVPDDLLAPFLLIGRAALDGAPCPDDEALAHIHGTRSAGRIRRLLEHLEKTGFIVLRTDYGGRRSVGIPGLNISTAPQE